MVNIFRSEMTSLVLGDNIQESLTPKCECTFISLYSFKTMNPLIGTLLKFFKAVKLMPNPSHFVSM